MQNIYIIDNEQKLKEQLKHIFKEEKIYKFKQIRTDEIDVALKDIPALIIINEDTITENVHELCYKIRDNDGDYHQHHAAQHRGRQRQEGQYRRNRPGEVIRRDRRVQKAGKGNHNLDGGQKVGGGICNLEQPRGGAVSLF